VLQDDGKEETAGGTEDPEGGSSATSSRQSQWRTPRRPETCLVTVLG
jgi:hypothetical protein